MRPKRILFEVSGMGMFDWLFGRNKAMTESEWLASTDPWSMLHVVKRSAPSERKVRLWNAAICRRFWGHLPAASQAILEESELLADGLIPRGSDDMELCWRANAVVAPFDRQYPKKQFPNAEVRIQRDAASAVCYAVIPNELWGAVGYFWDIDPAEKGPHSIIIRDVFGNPFRPVTLDPKWLKPNVVNLAQEIYNFRAFDRLPLPRTRAACERVLGSGPNSGKEMTNYHLPPGPDTSPTLERHRSK
jgi:hypothetical protein